MASAISVAERMRLAYATRTRLSMITSDLPIN